MLVLLPLMSNAQNTLVLNNNTGKTIRACYVSYDNSEQCWVNHGWYIIAPYKNFTQDLHWINLGSNDVYVHAENANSDWGGKFSFCVDETVETFKILFADKIKCQAQKTFDYIQVGQGAHKYDFNPQ